jgi:hypothetical protein
MKASVPAAGRGDTALALQDLRNSRLLIYHEPYAMTRLAHKIILYFASTPFVQRVIAERADLAAFREKPTLPVIAGVAAIIFSFLLGWPAIALLGIFSVWLHEPWFVVIGGPLLYGLSHLVFLLGMYLSGAVYSLIFCRWLTRVTMERCLAWVTTGQQSRQQR